MHTAHTRFNNHYCLGPPIKKVYELSNNDSLWILLKIRFCNIVEFLETLIAQAIDAFILMAAHFLFFSYLC